VQERYKFLIEREKMDDLKRLIEITRIAPKEEIVQKECKVLIKKGKMKCLEELIKITKINPKINEEIVQNKYKELIKQIKEFGPLKDLKILLKVSKIKPEKSILDELYKEVVD